MHRSRAARRPKPGEERKRARAGRSLVPISYLVDDKNVRVAEPDGVREEAIYVVAGQ